MDKKLLLISRGSTFMVDAISSNVSVMYAPGFPGV